MSSLSISWPLSLCIFLFSLRIVHYKPFIRILFYDKPLLKRISSFFEFFYYPLAIVLFTISLVSIFNSSISDSLLVFIVTLIILFDRLFFLYTTFYGLEDVLFASTSMSLLLFYFDLRYFNLSSGFSFIFISAALSSVYINAGFDKYKSSDWMSGKGFNIFASLPHYRLFNINNTSARFLRVISPCISRFEIIHQCLLPIFALIGIIFGLKLPLYLFSYIGLVFMATLIYPFSLPPISTYGLILTILCIKSLDSSNITSTVIFLYSFLTILMVLGVNCFSNKFNLALIIRVVTGMVKCGLFTEYHLHGRLFLLSNQKYSLLNFDSVNSRFSFKRLRLIISM